AVSKGMVAGWRRIPADGPFAETADAIRRNAPPSGDHSLRHGRRHARASPPRYSMTKQSSVPAAPRRRRHPRHDPPPRALLYQALVLGLVGFIVWYLVSNTLHNLAVRNISTGFGFLGREAGFAIGESPVAYTPADTYGRAIWVGLLNTLRVSVVGIVLAT